MEPLRMARRRNEGRRVMRMAMTSVTLGIGELRASSSRSREVLHSSAPFPSPTLNALLAAVLDAALPSLILPASSARLPSRASSPSEEERN